PHRRHNPAAGGMGRDPGGPDGDRRNLRDELRIHARTKLALRISGGSGRDRSDLRALVLPLQADRLALDSVPSQLNSRGSWRILRRPTALDCFVAALLAKTKKG